MKMTKTIYKTGIRDIDHATFGGIIYPSDFNTNCKGKNNANGSPIANRIINDWKFDEQCRKNRKM